MPTPNEPRKKAGLLPQTDWSHLDRLSAAPVDQQAPLLDVLARKYWTPIFHYLVSQGHDQFEAQDLAQDFFVFAMQSGLFTKADRERGRFRSFFLRSLTNFVANRRRENQAQKRQPSQSLVSLDELTDSIYFQPTALVDHMTPEALFHQAWVQEVIRNVLQRLHEHSVSNNQETHFQLFYSRVIAKELHGETPPPLQQQASELGLDYKEAANQIITAKRSFIRFLKEEIRLYATSEDDATAECHDILSLIRCDERA